MDDEIILRAEQISMPFPGTLELDRVWRGKVNVIIGENGAGKSTLILMKILAGVQQPNAGGCCF